MAIRRLPYDMMSTHGVRASIYMGNEIGCMCRFCVIIKLYGRSLFASNAHLQQMKREQLLWRTQSAPEVCLPPATPEANKSEHCSGHIEAYNACMMNALIRIITTFFMQHHHALPLPICARTYVRNAMATSNSYAYKSRRDSALCPNPDALVTNLTTKQLISVTRCTTHCKHSHAMLKSSVPASLLGLIDIN